MPLTITVVNSPDNTTISAFIEKVDNDGLPLDPRLVWSTDTDSFEEYPFTFADAVVALTESSDIPGLYSVTIAGINEESENLQITILSYNPPDTFALGQSTETPAAITPTVTLSLEANEDRD